MVQWLRVKLILHPVRELWHQDTSTALVQCLLSIRARVNHMLQLDGKLNYCNDNTMGLWRNGSASDSRSEGWELESLWPHLSMDSSLLLE